ncbi:MAG: heat-shock protein [Bacteroidetes bacterium]|jgi:HSP20 family protein|nr:heat-shock protein [Bacteroidota bacterium]
MTTLVKSNGHGRHFFPEFPSLFDDFFTRDMINFAKPTNNHLPAVNVKETDKAYSIEVAVPGMDKKDFKIELKNNLLVISAKKENKQEEKSEDGKYVRKEFGFQSFTRSFTLPEKSVEGENISANYTDGILNITIPKKEKEQTSSVREIQIS